jgi:hypothetical protein
LALTLRRKALQPGASLQILIAPSQPPPNPHHQEAEILAQSGTGNELKGGLAKAAFDALVNLIEKGQAGGPESQFEKDRVIDFLLEPGRSNAEKQEEIEALYQSIVSKFGPDVWCPMLYFNADSLKFYIPHHRPEADFVYTDGPWRSGLLKGGEGSGKSVAGVIKDLERIRRGMDGMLASPDLVHFKKSLWPEFVRWCPWNMVLPSQQYRGKPGWEPQDPFTLTFSNRVKVLCGGMDDPVRWDGTNVSWAHLDEARRKKDASALK